MTKITSGDTVTVTDPSNNKAIRLRLMCVDAPEMEQKPWGEKSFNLLKYYPIDKESCIVYHCFYLISSIKIIS